MQFWPRIVPVLIIIGCFFFWEVRISAVQMVLMAAKVFLMSATNWVANGFGILVIRRLLISPIFLMLYYSLDEIRKWSKYLSEMLWYCCMCHSSNLLPLNPICERNNEFETANLKLVFAILWEDGSSVPYWYLHHLLLLLQFCDCFAISVAMASMLVSIVLS